MEVLFVLLVISVAVAMITITGHLFWLIFAAIGRLFTGSSEAEPTQNSQVSPEARIRDDLQAANRLVNYARFKGWLTPTQIESLESLVAKFAERHAAERLNSTGASPAQPKVTIANSASVVSPELPPISFEDHTTSESEVVVAQTVVPAVVVPNRGIPTPAPTILHPLDAPDEPVSGSAATSPTNVAPKQPLSAELLRTFMERSNIRWVEIVSALLIVVCSVGLVISLWNTLSATSRYFPSMVFLLAAIAVHGVGQYTLRKWKLRSTSRGVLQIGLMLIPLAVLVGILLSRRPGQLPQFDGGTLIVLAAGTAIYGALAVTASRALFGSGWLPTAAAVIIGSASLVPIHFLSSRGLLPEHRSSLALAPIVLVSLFNSLQLSLVASRPVLSLGRMRRTASQVVQVIFAAAIPCAFWIMQSKGVEISKSAIAVGGMLFAGWASWGWTASLKRLAANLDNNRFSPNGVASTSGLSWYIFVAWCLAGTCSLALASLLWQAMDDRTLLTGSLVGLAVWWFAHGLRCGLITSQFAGTVASIISLSIFIEGWLPESSVQLQMTDWLSFTRVGLLSVVGLFVAIVGAFLTRWFPKSTELQSLLSIAPERQLLLPKFAIAILLGSIAVLLGTTSLTTIASLTRFSEPAFGGTWAPMMLLGYGSLLVGGSIFQSAELAGFALPQTSNRRWSKAMLLVGQLVLVLAAFKLCHSAPWAPQWLVDLRPLRAWAIGLGGLAVIWSLIAAVLRALAKNKDSVPSNISDWKYGFASRSLGYAAIGLSALSSLAYWSNNDKLLLASYAGWILPVVLCLSFFALRQSALREFSLLAVSLWLLSLFTLIGWRTQWWPSLALAATTSVLAIVQVTILSLHSALMRSKADSTMHWSRDGSRWASDLLLNLAWVCTLLTAIVPLAIQLYFNLRGGQLEEKFFVSAPFNLTRSMFVVLALIGLGLYTYTNRSSSTSLSRNWLATLSIMFAGLVGCQVSAPFGVPTALWMIAISGLAIELLPTLKLQLLKQQCLPSAIGDNRGWANPVDVTRGFCLGFLVTVTSLVFCMYFWRGLPSPLSPLVENTESWVGWLRNLSRILIWGGPLAFVLASRWIVAVVTVAGRKAIVLRGYCLGAFLTVVATFAGTREATATALFAAQSLTLAMALVSMITIGFTALRNWLGLRQLDRQSNAWQVLQKACRGARWRESQESARQLWIGSILPAILLCLTAGFLVAMYPRQVLPEVHALGGFWTVASVALSLSLWWIVGTSTALPKLGVVAITLSLSSPIISVIYAGWLLDHPGSKFVSANNYEPYRLQIGIWLAALVVGLAIRIYTLARSASMPRLVEICWIVLAVLVALLSIVGLEDKYWATMSLALLTSIIVVSGEASGQTWRGYVAAFCAMFAWIPWCQKTAGEIFFVWQSLMAIVLVSLLAVFVRYAIQWRKLNVCQQFQWTIDRTVVLSTSVFSVLMSGLWVALNESLVPLNSWALWSILAATALTWVLSVARVFQSDSCHRGLGVYLATIAFTLVAIQFACSHQQLARVYCHLAWWSGLLGAMSALAIALREIKLGRTPIQPFLQSRNLAIPTTLSKVTTWMSALHTLTAVVCLIPSVGLVLTMSQEGLRMAAIALPLLGVAAILPLSFERLQNMQRGSVLLLVSASLVLAWWADLPSALSLRVPNESWRFAQRAFLAFVLLAVLYPIVAYFRKATDPWISALAKGGWACLFLATAIGIGMVILTAMGHWSDYPALVSPMAKLSTCLGWTVIFARLIQFAAWPQGWDRGANIQLRTSAVYAAELSIALGCATTYYHFPDLFSSGRFVNWWPVILFAIAFASMLLGEWLKRVDLTLLADPIGRSSLLLPIIPLAGVWAFQPERATLLWSDFQRFAILLVIGSSLYGLHGWVRGSVALRALSVGLALLGYWSFLHGNQDLRFFDHPQFWLLPPAIGSLIFVEWNKSRFDATVVTSVRYTSILIAYFSSTSELFFKSFEGNLWPPVVLLFLALCGVTAGITLRVRAFLFCGMAFIVIALIGMVRNAAQAIDQNWPWWAFGIATGVGLIVMLGYFEKNRAKILAQLENLKQWEV